MIVGLELPIAAGCVEELVWSCDVEHVGRLVGFIACCGGADLHLMEFTLSRRNGETLRVLDKHPVPVSKLTHSRSMAKWVFSEGDRLTLSIFNRDYENENWFHGGMLIEGLTSDQLLWWADIETGALIRPLRRSERGLKPGTRSGVENHVVVDPKTYEGFAE